MPPYSDERRLLWVDVAENGEEGLRLAKVKPFDLILVDLMMPVMSGSEMMEQVRQYDPEISTDRDYRICHNRNRRGGNETRSLRLYTKAIYPLISCLQRTGVLRRGV